MRKEELAEANIHIFNEVYQIKNEHGTVLDFKDHAYLWDIYSDLSPYQAVRKAAQIGFSTAAIIKTMHLAHSKKMDIIYTLPTYGDVHEFVTTKTNRIIEQNPIFQKWTSDKDTIEQKRIGQSVIHYRGTWSERSALMIASDLNVHDEMDRSNLKVVDQYYSRLQHSKFAWQWVFSNPSVPDQGVDKQWNRSDQKHWFLKCSGCNHWQYLTMANVKGNPGEYYFGCNKCGKELERRGGEWVQRWTQPKPVSGYWVSLLMAPWTSANTIMTLKNTKPADYFANFVLGEPYVGSGNAVTRDMLTRNLTPTINRQEGRIVIGVDPGMNIRWVIGNSKGLFGYGQSKNYGDLELMMTRYRNAIMVIDRGGDIAAPNELQRKFPNRVYFATYRGDTSDEEFFDFDDKQGKVLIQRNKAIQLLVDEFTDKRIPLQGNELDWEDYWQHWSHIYRIAEENSLGVKVYKWNRSDRDDWVHATVYWRAGMDRFMGGEGAFIQTDTSGFAEAGYTATPDGRFLMPTRAY